MVVDYLSMSSVDFGVPDFSAREIGALPDSSRARRQKIKAVLEFRQLISPSVAGLTQIPKEKF
jgi:hypothetical protein